MKGCPAEKEQGIPPQWFGMLTTLSEVEGRTQRTARVKDRKSPVILSEVSVTSVAYSFFLWIEISCLGWRKRLGMDCEQLKDGRCLAAGIPAPASMCAHCREDGTGLFRAGLAAQRAKRELKLRLARDNGRFACSRYGLTVDDLFCAECRQNPALKQVLGARRGMAVRSQQPCLHRGEQVGEVEVKCCGGKRKMVPAYVCDERPNVKVVEQDCLRCASYESKEPPKPEPAACASWESLWKVHEGKTVLVLASGPSVLLPGDDASADTVDPRKVEADVVVSTNWAWKWYDDIIDYQVSYDPTPCLGWRPAHTKLLTPVRPKATQAVLARANVYCFFPACDYGEIAQGKPLPCSRNSGYAAIAFAAYAGARVIKVLGMDFGPGDGRMHFYHESEFDVSRRVKSFGRQKQRVQGDLTKLLRAVRALSVTVDNLSSHSELDWTNTGNTEEENGGKE
jgi:hypothetical protein